MGEWIPEAMGIMRTRVTYQKCWKYVNIEFHKGRLPCGLHAVLGVMHNGYRVDWSNSILAASAPQPEHTYNNNIPLGPVPDTITVFDTTIAYYQTPEQSIIYDTLLTQVRQAPCGGHTYYTELDYINTSLRDGKLTVLYDRIPLDQEGFPIIPDNEQYKEALYWYCRAKMIGSGYPDKVFKEEVCMERFELAAARAIGQIKYPSIDKMETMFRTNTRLIMPENYYEDFFENTGKEDLNHRTT